MREFRIKPKWRRIDWNIMRSACSRFPVSAKVIALAGAVLILNPFLGCAGQQMVGMDQDNTTITLRVNEVFQIELPGNAGTGFEWRFDHLEDAFFVLVGSEKKIFKEDDPNYVGNAYLQTWSLKALKAGGSDIRLIYYRPWEGEEMAEKRFGIEVIIEP